MKKENDYMQMNSEEKKIAERYFEKPDIFVLENALKIFAKTKCTIIKVLVLYILKWGATWL